MKKSFKRFLIISQVLGWSALFASACTDHVNNAPTSDSSTSKANDPTEKHSDAGKASEGTKENQVQSKKNGEAGESHTTNTTANSASANKVVSTSEKTQLNGHNQELNKSKTTP